MAQRALISVLATFLCLICGAQESEKYFPEEKVVSFDTKTWDFGDILLSDGPKKCTFHFKNIADFPIQIFNAVSSCGCTKPVWTEGFIKSGESGKIDVFFSNTQGPYPFDKSITLYFSNVKKPVIIHVKGVAYDKMKPLAERFPFHFGTVGLRNLESTVLNMEQGRSRADKVTIANFGKKSASVKVIPFTQGLSADVYPNPIPAGKTAELSYSVNTQATEGRKWGREKFFCKFDVDGESFTDTFVVNAFIRDDFSDMDDAALALAPKAMAERSYFEMGEVPSGRDVTAEFTIKNIGSSDMTIRKVDSDDPLTTSLTKVPITVKKGESAVVKAKVDTRRPKGEVLTILSVLTNSPEKPLLQLYITGNIK